MQIASLERSRWTRSGKPWMLVESKGVHMPRSTRSLVRRKLLWSVATGVACLGTLSIEGCVYDDSGWQLDQDSGASRSRGGSSNTSGGKGQSGSMNQAGHGDERAGGSAGAGGEGSEGASVVGYPEPEIKSMEPTSGPYGTPITIKGVGLGNRSLAGFTLAVGSQGEVTLTPKDRATVVSWTDEEIVFRYPFPAEGGVALEGPKGDAMVGEFQPTWHVALEIDQAPAVTVLASISPAADRIVMLYDTMPLSLVDVGPQGVVEHSVTAPGVDPKSLRLYLNAARKVEGIGISTDAVPVLVHLQNVNDDLVAKPTAISLQATEVGIAGGSEGAAVWMRRAAGWFRARPSVSGWADDKGPITDPNPNAPDRTSGVSSDGSLFVAWSVDTGNFLDDMEAGYMQQLTPTATKFAAAKAAGNSVDDYVTGLMLQSSGDGLVVTTCGSDVDPFALSGTDYYCFDSLHAPSGAHLFGVRKDQTSVAHAFTRERAVAAYCSGDGNWMIQTDADVETTPGAALGEPVLFPCPQAVALEVSGSGDYLPIVRWAGKTYLVERNPAAKL